MAEGGAMVEGPRAGVSYSTKPFAGLSSACDDALLYLSAERQREREGEREREPCMSSRAPWVLIPSVMTITRVSAGSGAQHPPVPIPPLRGKGVGDRPTEPTAVRAKAVSPDIKSPRQLLSATRPVPSYHPGEGNV